MKNTDKNSAFKKKKFIITAHESVRWIGPVYDFLQFFFEKGTPNLLLIQHPLLFLKETYVNSSYCEYYKNGKLYRKHTAFHWKLPEGFLYIKDFFYTILWPFYTRDTYDLFIGFNPLNAFAGIVLKKLGKVRKVVYYTLDYFTQRFENKLLNKMYHSIDKFCVYHADETWNVSKAMVTARKNYNDMPKAVYNRQHTVPIGVWLQKIPRKTYNQINKKKIIFIGSLVTLMGVDLLLKAMPKIIEKIPDVKLEIVGGGPEEKNLILLAKKLFLMNHISFHGWIKNNKDKWRMLSDASIGIAPFNTKIFREEVKNADPAKVKEYLAMGVPVIATDAVSKNIEKAKCGLIVPFDVNYLANAIITLLPDNNKLMQYRKNAIKYMKQFDFENIARVNLERVLTQNSI